MTTVALIGATLAVAAAVVLADLAYGRHVERQEQQTEGRWT